MVPGAPPAGVDPPCGMPVGSSEPLEEGAVAPPDAPSAAGCSGEFPAAADWAAQQGDQKRKAEKRPAKDPGGARQDVARLTGSEERLTGSSDAERTGTLPLPLCMSTTRMSRKQTSTSKVMRKPTSMKRPPVRNDTTRQAGQRLPEPTFRVKQSIRAKAPRLQAPAGSSRGLSGQPWAAPTIARNEPGHRPHPRGRHRCPGATSGPRHCRP